MRTLPVIPLLLSLICFSTGAHAQAHVPGELIKMNIITGKVLCRPANPTAKTCNIITKYILLQDSKLLDVSAKFVSLRDQSPVVANTVIDVEIKGNMICGMITQDTVDTMTFTIDGKPAPAEVSQQLRTQLAPTIAKAFGLEVCEGFVLNGREMRTETYLGGKRLPAADVTVQWVDQGAGYTVGN